MQTERTEMFICIISIKKYNDLFCYRHHDQTATRHDDQHYSCKDNILMHCRKIIKQMKKMDFQNGADNNVCIPWVLCICRQKSKRHNDDLFLLTNHFIIM